MSLKKKRLFLKLNLASYHNSIDCDWQIQYPAICCPFLIKTFNIRILGKSVSVKMINSSRCVNTAANPVQNRIMPEKAWICRFRDSEHGY